MPPSGKTTLTIQRASQLRESMTIPRGLQRLLITERTMVAFRKKGTDPARLETLFKANTCQCAMSMCFVFLFRSFLCFQIVGMCKKNETSHLQNHHHPTTGALKICFKQFRDSKDLVAFLERFWGMSKQDQDALVPIQKYDIFSTPIQQILVGYPHTHKISAFYSF